MNEHLHTFHGLDSCRSVIIVLDDFEGECVNSTYPYLLNLRICELSDALLKIQTRRLREHDNLNVLGLNFVLYKGADVLNKSCCLAGAGAGCNSNALC